MATSTFKSSTRRASGIGADDAASSTRDITHRRYRSLSRYSGRVPPPDEPLPSQAPATGRFVNTERGSGFPEVRLDELADEFFAVRDWEEELERGRDWGRGGNGGGRRLSGFAMETESSRRRGRSVSRKSGDSESKGDGSDGGVRRRRSVSVARRHVVGDTEVDMNGSHKSSSQQTKQGTSMTLKTNSSNHVLRRSTSHRDLQQSHDSYSSQSSSLTDDEARSVRTSKTGAEKTIRAVYAQKKCDHPTVDGEVNGLYQAMRKEVRDAVDDIRIELEKVMVNTKPSMMTDGDDIQAEGSDVIKAITEIRRSYASKLEESEKRKQKLLAELAAEEYHGQELTKIVKGLLPEAKQNTKQERPSRGRRRSNDKTGISNRLTQEAEKYFEDFILNVEDTDISSFDGEKSDTSSTVGGSIKSRDPLMHSTFVETQENLAKDAPAAETDGVVLPWLQWETNNDISPLSNNKRVRMLTSGNNLNNKLQEATSVHDNSNVSLCSYNNWSANCNGSSQVHGKTGSQSEGARSFTGSYPVNKNGCHSFDMSEYIGRQRDEDLLLEIYRQRQRIDSGSLIFCRRSVGFYPY